MKLAYPIILIPFEDGGGYTVEVPDLPGCVTEGRDLAEALFMAQDAASGWVLTELEDGRPAPKASDASGIDVGEPGALEAGRRIRSGRVRHVAAIRLARRAGA